MIRKSQRHIQPHHTLYNGEFNQVKSKTGRVLWRVVCPQYHPPKAVQR